MKKIYSKCNDLLVISYSDFDWKKGLDFVTDDNEFLQVGTWWYDQGKKLDRHHHNIAERKSNLTQECVVVLSGSMSVKVYDYDKQFLDEFVLYSDEFAVFLGGGHSYDILENNTKIIETKNGPFLGVETDKTRF